MTQKASQKWMRKTIMPNHLTKTEQSRLEEIRAAIAELRKERDALMSKARVRRHRAS